MATEQTKGNPHSGPPPLSKKRQRALERQQKLQERQRAKAARRRTQRNRVKYALRAIGATWEKGGRSFLEAERRYYVVNWQGQRYTFAKPGDIVRWAQAQQTPGDLDYADMEIARLIEQARQELEPNA